MQSRLRVGDDKYLRTSSTPNSKTRRSLRISRGPLPAATRSSSHPGVATPQTVLSPSIIGDFQRMTIARVDSHRSSAPFSLLSDVPEFGHSFLSFPDFLWAHRSGNSSLLRPTRLLLCWFRPQQHWVPSNKADASLRLHAPSLSLVPQRTRGRKKR